MNNITCPHCDQVFEIDAAGYAEIAKQVRSAEFESDLHDRLEEAAKRHKMEIELAKKEASEKNAKESVKNERKITELQGQLKPVGVGTIGGKLHFPPDLLIMLALELFVLARQLVAIQRKGHHKLPVCGRM